jgi:HEAT repeat protein
MDRCLAWCGVLLALSALAAAQQPTIAWEADFDAALKAAKADGKPIMVAFIMDAEPANDEVANDHFHDKDIVAASQGFHCLVASVGLHGAKPDEGVCQRFGTSTCACHQRVQMRAQTAYLQSPEVSAPQFIFLKPDGETVLLRHVWMLPKAELYKKMRLALGFNDPAKVSEAEKQVGQEVALALQEADDNNAVKRMEGLRKLAALDDPRIMEFLIKQTAEGVDEQRRLEAIDAMGTKGNAKALPALLKLLPNKSAQIRARVIGSLERLAMPEAGPALLAALKREPKDNLKALCVRALAICDPKTPAHAKAVIGMIAAGSQTERCAAIRASFELAPDASVKKALLVAAKDNSAQVRGCAFCALAHHKVQEGAQVIEKAISLEKVQAVKGVAEAALAILAGESKDGASARDLLARLPAGY